MNFMHKLKLVKLKPHKYSQNAVELFKKVKSGVSYEIKI